MSDPFDELGLSRSGEQARFEEPSDPPPRGYGHIPQVSGSRANDSYPIARAQIRRDAFWQNVCREILMALSTAAAHASGRLSPGPSAANSSTSPLDEIFDGRMAVITTLGQRIPIADVFPVFAFSVSGCAEDRARSGDVQCTVFRITTPTGETYTLPIAQIVGVHTLSESLIDQLEDAHNQGQEDDENKVPFGFSAYTSMARSEQQAHQQHQESQEPQPAPPETQETPPEPPTPGS